MTWVEVRELQVPRFLKCRDSRGAAIPEVPRFLKCRDFWSAAMLAPQFCNAPIQT